MPMGCAIHHAVGLRDRRHKVRAGQRAVGAEAIAQQLRQCPRPRLLGVRYDQALHAFRQQRMCDGGPCAAGADLHDATPRDIRQASSERLGEAGHVGVMPDALPIAQHDGIHRPQRLRFGRKRIEQRHYGLLAGKGDVQPGEAHPFRRAQQVGQRLGTEPQGIEINAPIGEPQPGLRGFAFVHRGRVRSTDARPDEAGENGRALVPLHHEGVPRADRAKLNSA